MIGTLISIIFVVIIFGVVWWAINELLPLVPMAEPFRRIVHVLMILVVILVVLWIVWQLIVASGLMTASFPRGLN